MKQPHTEKSSVSELKPWPSFIHDRLNLWEKLKAEKDAEVAAKIETAVNVTLPDGKIVEGIAWKTSPYDVARGIRYALGISKSNE